MKKEEIKRVTLEETIIEAKNRNKQIANMITQVEDIELSKNIREIHDTATKIINTIEKNPEKYKKVNNFFDYYLPITIQILNKYDEIENQKLNSQESIKFMKSTQEMVVKINQAFQKQLSNLYQSDMIDTDAEMKVFDMMLKSEGYNQSEDFNIVNKEEKK